MNPLFRAFAHRNYRLYWAGFVLSFTGTWMQSMAQSWLVWRLTESPFWLGIVGALPQIPSLVLGSIGGVLVDRTVKRRLLIITQLGLSLSALALAAVTLSGAVRVGHVVAIAAVTGVFTAIDTPARLSFVSEIVGREHIGNAVALNATTFNAARLVGPSVAGLLVPLIGEGGIFLFNGISFFAMIGALLLMRDLPPPSYDRHGSVAAQWREAFRYVRETPIPRTLLLNVVVFAGLGFSYNVLMPVFADKILHSGARGLGILMGSVGVGALAGGLWQAMLPPDAKRGGQVKWGAIGMCGGLLLCSLSRDFFLTFAALVGVGVAGIIMLASTNTLLQTLAPDALRGRVLGFYTTSFMGVMPLGSLLVGTTAAYVSAPLTLGVAAAVCFILAVVILARNRELKSV